MAMVVLLIVPFTIVRHLKLIALLLVCLIWGAARLNILFVTLHYFLLHRIVINVLV